MVFEFVVPIRPISANRKPSEQFTLKIREAAKKYNLNGLFHLRHNLFARIVWFHRVAHKGQDTDNIAKRILDSLKNCAYNEDTEVSRCYIDRVSIAENFDLEDSPFNGQVSDDLAELLDDQNHKHILYVAVGNINSSKVIFKLGE
jgi:hypothetical protein